MYKMLFLFVIVCSVSGCWYGQDVLGSHPVLQDRAKKLCEPYAGVYLWGGEKQYGKVMCYQDKIICDAFTNTCGGKE